MTRSEVSGEIVAAVYARVSSAEQRERQTIQTQLDDVALWAQRNGIQVALTYTDDGVTGTLPLASREAGGSLLSDAQRGLFNLLLVYRIDRLGRDTRGILDAVAELESVGVQVKSISEPFDTTNPAGKLLLTMLSGFASFERDSILERSKAGTRRLAKAGVWLGGIVPYGYQVEGLKQDARLVPALEPIPGFQKSEAEVVGEIFERVGMQLWSCQRVADLLNAQSLPTVYARDGRNVGQGKRKQATAGLWYTGRIRAILTNTTYKGIHQYGKRSKTQSVIEREVPALVDAELWEAAKAALKHNQIHAVRNTRRQYLLRSLIRCAHCGHAYVGTASKGRVYYQCTSKQTVKKGRINADGKCPSRYVRAEELEAQIWTDIEGFLRDPGDAVALLDAQADADAVRGDELSRQLVELDEAIGAKETERNRMLGLYRKGIINDATLEEQLDLILQDELHLQDERVALQQSLSSQGQHRQAIKTAEAVLQKLSTSLDEGLAWEKKRELVLALVERIAVDSSEPEMAVHVTYCFSSVTSRTDRGSARRRA